MVWVFKRFIFSLGMLVLIANSSLSSAEDIGNLKEDLKKDVQSEFQKSLGSENSAVRAWLKETLDQVSKLATDVKSAEALLRQSSASVNPAIAAEIVTTLSPDVKKILCSVGDRGWEKSIADIKGLLDAKNIYLEDLLKDSKLISSFAKRIAEEERKFWKQKNEVESTTPITEAKVELTPSGNLSQGLRVLGVLKFFMDEAKFKEAFKVEEQPVLLRSILELKLEAPKAN